MNSKQKTFWITSALLLIVHLIIQYYFIINNNFSDNLLFIRFIGKFIGIIIIGLLFGLIIGSLLALVSFKGKKYRQKLKITFPFCTSLVLILLISSFGYLAYVEHKNGERLNGYLRYSEVKVPDITNCSTLRTGSFETENLLIERTEKKQIQIDKKTNKKIEYLIDWKTECEYYLIPINNQSEKIKVKIVSNSLNSYDCYVTNSKYLIEYAHKYTIKTVANKTYK